MTDQLLDIPLSDINPDALPRDRTANDAEALAELQLSIVSEGLRQPIEVFEYAEDDEGPHRYGLISGYRRLSVYRWLERETIPAFLRRPRDVGQMLTAMVSENEIRAQISPWEKGRLILTCLKYELYPNADTAIDALFPALSRQKKSRLRGLVLVVETFDGLINTPERLSTARLDRLAAALRAGWEDLLLNALPHRRSHSLESQWAALEPVIHEALNPRANEAAPGSPRAPRRMLKPGRNIVVRRELTRTGWILRFTGPGARSPGIIDDVMDEIERIFSDG